MICSISFGQSIEFSIGGNYNMFYDLRNFQKDYGNFSSSYTPKLGYSFLLGVSDLKVDSLKRARIVLFVNKYKGNVKISDGGLGFGYEIDVDVSKTNIGLGLYPLNFYLDQDIQLSLGGEFSYLLEEKIIGKKSKWSMTNAQTSQEIGNGTNEKSYKSNFGLSGSINYRLKLLNKWYLSPEYKYYLGLTKEFINIDGRTKSMRHLLMIRLIKSIE